MKMRSFSRVLVMVGAAVSTTASFLPFQPDPQRIATRSPDLEVFDQTLDALSVMQDEFFAPWIGTWPTSIDWTAAVMGTHVSGTLTSLSLGLELLRGAEDYSAKENLISLYFSQVLSYYFGMDHFAIRNEAYDDILWVVLGWLETLQFIDLHSGLHYPPGWPKAEGISEILRNQTWHGSIWIPAFSHRSRVFWDLAEKGWDTDLCDGGMTWNPRLEPYKNAITNELYIAASISMYLYSPGDNNGSPFIQDDSSSSLDNGDVLPPQPPHDTRHLIAAVDGYEWLVRSGMMNRQGLYIDGFHISNWHNPSRPRKDCDVPNRMVYSYNQGVLLTGHIGLWKVTGDHRFLADGHRLIQNVIRATGYDLERDRPIHEDPDDGLPEWQGLGRFGVLEDLCDIKGDCSQNGQTFKGIFFHHLATFCAPLEIASRRAVPTMHKDACKAYLGWLRHNAAAAVATRNSEGKFGMWWTIGLLNMTSVPEDVDRDARQDPDAVDYRNYGVPNDDLWVLTDANLPPSSGPAEDSPYGSATDQDSLSSRKRRSSNRPSPRFSQSSTKEQDLNDRGRGRTVETQGSGLALLRALWEISSR